MTTFTEIRASEEDQAYWRGREDMWKVCVSQTSVCLRDVWTEKATMETAGSDRLELASIRRAVTGAWGSYKHAKSLRDNMESQR